MGPPDRSKSKSETELITEIVQAEVHRDIDGNQMRKGNTHDKGRKEDSASGQE